MMQEEGKVPGDGLCRQGDEIQSQAERLCSCRQFTQSNRGEGRT